MDQKVLILFNSDFDKIMLNPLAIVRNIFDESVAY